MKQIIEQPNISTGEKLADKIRRKIAQNIPLTKQEEAFLQKQREEDREDDNPRYGH